MADARGEQTSGDEFEMNDFEDFATWWAFRGSKIVPLDHHDMEEHAKRVAWEAWDALDSQRMKDEAAELKKTVLSDRTKEERIIQHVMALRGMGYTLMAISDELAKRGAFTSVE